LKRLFSLTFSKEVFYKNDTFVQELKQDILHAIKLYYKNVVELRRTKRRVKRTSENIRGPDGKSGGARRKFKFPTETRSVGNSDGTSYGNPSESVGPRRYFRQIREAQISRRALIALKFWGGGVLAAKLKV